MLQYVFPFFLQSPRPSLRVCKSPSGIALLTCPAKNTRLNFFHFRSPRSAVNCHLLIRRLRLHQFPTLNPKSPNLHLLSILEPKLEQPSALILSPQPLTFNPRFLMLRSPISYLISLSLVIWNFYSPTLA